MSLLPRRQQSAQSETHNREETPAANPEVTKRTIEVSGILLPWEYHNPYAAAFPDDYPEGDNYRNGEVFIPLDTLYELNEQGRDDSMFGSAFLLGWTEGLVLVALGFAEKETRGGFHSTPVLKDWLDKQSAQESDAAPAPPQL